MFRAFYQGGTSLYSGSVDGKELKLLELDPWTTADWSWSPDGRSIAFFRRSNTYDIPNAIWVMAPDGSGLRKVFEYPPNTGAIRAPKWSPDSTRLAVWGGGVWTIDVSTATSRQVLAGPLFTAAWLADSNRVVADPWGPVTHHPDGTSSHQTSVEVIDAVSGARRQIHLGGVVYTTTPSGDVVVGSPLVISDTGERLPYRFEGIARTFAPDGRHFASEDAETIFVYDHRWCGRPLVDVKGPAEHWLGWAGPSAMLVNVNPQVG